MKKLLTVLFLTFLLSSAGTTQVSRKEVVGYFPSWKWQSRENLVTPSKLPYDKLTTINYAFFIPFPDGTIGGKDSTGDRMYLKGPHELTLVGQAHRHGVRVLLSLGGWSESDHFPVVASNPRLRAVFAHSCVEAILRDGFDGIDIDWEYPGYAEHKGSPADKENFTLLLSVLKDSLNVLGDKTQRSYLLTAALPAGGEHVQKIEVAKVAKILDQLNLMTYDFHGPWDPLANHNSPLYPSVGADPTRCVDASFRLYCDTLGVPASKINIGVPFYGKAFAGCAGLNAPHAGADTTLFPESGLFYYDIAPVLGKFNRLWDEKAKVPYLTSSASQVLVSYDDEESVRAKGEYVVDHGIHGVIIWEITGDYLPDGSTPLLDALVIALRTTPRPVH